MSFRISGETRRLDPSHFGSRRSALDVGSSSVEAKAYAIFSASAGDLPSSARHLSMARPRPAPAEVGTAPAAPSYAGTGMATAERRALDICVVTAKHPFAFSTEHAG